MRRIRFAMNQSKSRDWLCLHEYLVNSRGRYGGFLKELRQTLGLGCHATGHTSGDLPGQNRQKVRPPHPTDYYTI